MSNSTSISEEFAKYRQAVIEEPKPVTAAVEEKKPITARLQYDSVGVCLYCNKVMGKTMVCGQPMFLCKDDRFVSPLPDAELDSGSFL